MSKRNPGPTVGEGMKWIFDSSPCYHSSILEIYFKVLNIPLIPTPTQITPTNSSVSSVAPGTGASEGIASSCGTCARLKNTFFISADTALCVCNLVSVGYIQPPPAHLGSVCSLPIIHSICSDGSEFSLGRIVK